MSNEKEQNNTILDCRGLACPQPVILTKKALDQLPESLTVSGTLWYDRPGSSRNHFEAIRRARTTVCYRDCLQTVYGVLTSLSWGITSGRYAQLTLAITPTMVDEADLVDRQVLLVEDPPGSGEWRITGVTGEVSIFDLIGG